MALKIIYGFQFSIQFHHFDHRDEANNLFKKIKEKCKSKIGRSCVLLDCQHKQIADQDKAKKTEQILKTRKSLEKTRNNQA